MEHELAVELLDEYRDGALPAAEAAGVAAHFEACPACRTRLEERERLSAALFAGAPAPSEVFVAKVMARVRAEEREEEPAGWGWLAPAFAFAAAVVLAILRPVARPVSAQSLVASAGPVAAQSVDLLGLAQEEPR
ncbi:MAG TPA: zf-HC2 domain-containing protein [Elusimicrobiota bacterium]|jgi:anti-sigma factor RsiW|nr:zf-HC2 domain-containing protein [Elusimicrobiota bacterium]